MIKCDNIFQRCDVKFNYRNMLKALVERTGGQGKRKGSFSSVMIMQESEIYCNCLS